MLLTSHLIHTLLSSVLCSRQCFQVYKASLQRTSSTIILLMFENVVNNILFVLLVLFFKGRLIFSHVGRHLEFLEFPKGNNSTPTWILLYSSKRYIIRRKKSFIRQCERSIMGYAVVSDYSKFELDERTTHTLII